GDEVLDAVEHEAVAAALVGRLHFQGVAAGFRLGEAEGQNLFTPGRGRQVAPLLLLVAPGQDRVFADRHVPGEEGAYARPLAADAGQGTDVGDRVRAPAAVRWRQDHAEQIVLARQGEDLVVKAVLDVAQLLDGANLLAERFHVSEEPLLVGRVHERNLL